MVFTEFMEMVESRWSLDLVDAIIERSRVASGGSYTAVGNYPHQEILALVEALAQETGDPPATLLRAFGRHLFQRYSVVYPRFFPADGNAVDFLAGIEEIIHAEVRRLYPEVELPSFEVVRGPNTLTLNYYSKRPLEELAHGLIEGCIAHFGTAVDLTRLPPPAQARACFQLRWPG